jgi:signal peptidase II
VATRWHVLIAVALSVALLDQVTKLLAVRHLTPGIANAHLKALGLAESAPEEKHRALEGLSFVDGIAYFYGTVREPCKELRAHCPSVRVIDGFWSWRYVENPGAAWGLLAGASEELRIPFFFVVSIGAMIFILWFYRKLRDDQHLLVWSLALVFGGAIGNFIDRLHLSYVVDFIDWYVGRHHWPTFNLADAAITVGVSLLVLDMFVNKEPSKAAEVEATHG